MSNADIFKLYIQQPKVIASVSADGIVKLNWEEIIRASEDAASAHWAFAHIMLAIRAHTWKPLE